MKRSRLGDANAIWGEEHTGGGKLMGPKLIDVCRATELTDVEMRRLHTLQWPGRAQN